MHLERASGILLHPTSFPSRFGIGDLGRAAYEFIDFLERSGQKVWQILPLGPTGYEHSPYIMNFSTFAGNPLLISLDRLAEEGLLNSRELLPLPDNHNPQRVDFPRVIAHKGQYLKQAFDCFWESLQSQPNHPFEEFCQQKASWLNDYALFMALLEQNDGKDWNQWEPAIARREPQALQAKTEELHTRIIYHKFLQFKFFEQWSQLRRYTNNKGIKIIGDISIYVCYNSADVWFAPNNFQLHPETLNPAYIAGVPPDYFSATGQLWGNPVYDWDELKRTNFAWWIERFRATLEYVDWVRVDHFRGFEAYWRVPFGETSALNGEWVTAPGAEFFESLGQQLGSLPVLAEDLGIITPEVEELRDRFEFPGMKILMFAFGEDSRHPYLPHNYTRNSIVYTGTHDNDTTVGWWQTMSPEIRQHVAGYLGYAFPEAIEDINWALIRLALSSIADLAIFPFQDLLGLDNRGRMNDPSTNAGNWRWRYESSTLLTHPLCDRLRYLTQMYSR
ncbi:4-alpha-glucanotransferase [Limnospira fusiformis]|uniref:4-alpha-glucanotransferase n=1 Tax=Limnospira fusiformis TaxID=54297 RepID=UPI0034E06585